MAKKVAVLAVDPVNGFGLFQYLEAFFENGIPYKTFAVANSREIMTNSGVRITLDDVVANLPGHEDEFGALVFACGDAVPKFAEYAHEQYNKEMMEAIKRFAAKGKILAGHCAAAMMFDKGCAVDGKKVAIHPLAKAAILRAEATDSASEIDGNVFTAQTENTIRTMMPKLLKALQ